MGIDLIWFGVLLAVNMQTSFMHPPFGFALFYLRSVAPKDDYIDRVTKKIVAGVKTAQIYWGSVPFIVIQLLMVAAVMLFPGMVTHYKSDQSTIDPATVRLSNESTWGQDSYGFGAPEAGDSDPAAAFR